MVGKSLVDLADETLMAIAKYLVAPEDIAQITVASGSGKFASDWPLNNNRDIVAFMSICGRLRSAIQPFGLCLKIRIKGSTLPLEHRFDVPLRFLHAITQLYLTYDPWDFRHHHKLCIGQHVSSIVSALPSLVSLLVATNTNPLISLPIDHACSGTQHGRLEKLRHLIVSRSAAICLASQPWRLDASQLRTLRIGGDPLEEQSDTQTMYSWFSMKTSLDTGHIRNLQVSLWNLQSRPNIIRAAPKILCVAEKFPRVREFGIISSYDIDLVDLDVACEDSTGILTMSSSETAAEALQALSSFTNLERLNTFFCVKSHPNRQTMRISQLSKVPLSAVGHLHAEYVEAERIHLRRVVGTVAMEIQKLCPGLVSGGLWIFNTQIPDNRYWWEWAVMKDDDGVKTIRVAPYGIPHGLVKNSV